MSSLNTAYESLFAGIMIVFAVLLILVLIRAMIGPRIADRLMAINMIGTIAIILMAIVAVKLEEDYLVDISIIYAMISFLSVVILTKVYMGVHIENELKLHKLLRQKRQQAEMKEKKGETE